MSHSWNPDGTERDDDAAHAAAQPEDSEQHADPQAEPGAAQPGPYQRPSFGAAEHDAGQFPIPPQAWRPEPPSDTGSGDDGAAAGGEPAPSRGVTSGAPLPAGPFFPAGQEPPAPPQPSDPASDAGTFVNWEPPPRVDWRPEPAPARGGRRRRGRGDAAAREPFFAPESQGYPAPQAHAQAQAQAPQPGAAPQPAQYAPPEAPPAGQHPAPHPQQAPQGWTAQHPQHAPAPQRTPRPEDLLAPNVRPADAEPASWGWRGRVHRGSGGLLKPKAGAEELAVRSAIERIQYGFSRPMTVVVIQPKGGAGKTPTTICLASAFGAYRGGYVVGWDDNETRGTLAVRVANTGSQTSTVWDLLSDLEGFERSDARVGDLGYYVRAQPDAHFDALVSDDNPGNMSQIGEDEFHRLHRVLGRFYRMIVVDTGNNVRSPNWQAAVNAADLVVVVSSYQRDVGYSGSWVLDHLAQTGREELARNAVTVLSAADPTPDKAVRAQLLEHFHTRTRAVVEIPYDAALAHGGPIRWAELAQPTRNAWTLAAATVVDALAEQDRARRR